MGGLFEGLAGWWRAEEPKPGADDRESVPEPEPESDRLVEGDLVIHRVPLGIERRPTRLFKRGYWAGPGLLAPVLDLTETLGMKLPTGMLVVLPAQTYKDLASIEGWLTKAVASAQKELQNHCLLRGVPVPSEDSPFHVTICGDSDPVLGDLPLDLTDGEVATLVSHGLVLPQETAGGAVQDDVVLTFSQRRVRRREELLGRVPSGRATITLGTSPLDSVRIDRADLRPLWPEAVLVPRLMTLRRDENGGYEVMEHRGPGDLVVRATGEAGSLQLYWRRLPLARLEIRTAGVRESVETPVTAGGVDEPTTLSAPPSITPAARIGASQTFLGETALLRVGYAVRSAGDRSHRVFLTQEGIRPEGTGAHIDVAPGGTLTLEPGADTTLLDGKLLGRRPTPLLDEQHEIEIDGCLYVYRKTDRGGPDPYHLGYLLFETPREDRFLLPSGTRRTVGRGSAADIPACRSWWRGKSLDGPSSGRFAAVIEEMDVSRKAVELLAMPHAGEVRVWRKGRGPVVRFAADRGETARIEGHGGQALRIDGSDLLVVGTAVFMAVGVSHMLEAFPRLVGDLRASAPGRAEVVADPSSEYATVYMDDPPCRSGRPTGVSTEDQPDDDVYARALTVLDSEIQLEEPVPNLYGRVPRGLSDRPSLPRVFALSPAADSRT